MFVLEVEGLGLGLNPKTLNPKPQSLNPNRVCLGFLFNLGSSITSETVWSSLVLTELKEVGVLGRVGFV